MIVRLCILCGGRKQPDFSENRGRHKIFPTLLHFFFWLFSVLNTTIFKGKKIYTFPKNPKRTSTKNEILDKIIHRPSSTSNNSIVNNINIWTNNDSESREEKQTLGRYSVTIIIGLLWVTAPKNWTTFGCRIFWSKASSSLNAFLKRS